METVNAVGGAVAMFSVNPETVFKLEQQSWRLAGLWPGAAKRRLWLSQPVTQTDSTQHYLAIFAIVRNEGAYLNEWVEFHRMMGVIPAAEFYDSYCVCKSDCF